MKIANYIIQLERVLRGGNWVQESFDDKLRELTSEQVFAQPFPGVHSVAELVWHCAYWRRVTLSRLRGEKNTFRDETIATQNFLALGELKARGWQNIREALDETQVQLVNFLKDKSDSFLNTEYQPGHSYDFLLEGTIHHDYYHLGQIGLVVRVLKDTR